MKTKLLLLMICGFLLPLLSYGQSWTLIGYAGGITTSLLSGGPGSYNTGFGQVTLSSLNYGANNSAFGQGALESLTGSGSDANNNSAFGQGALYLNVSGSDNDAFGFQAQYKSTVSDNDAFGSQALYNNEDGIGNVAIGFQSLYTPTSISYNVSIGYQAMYLSTAGEWNDAVGEQALYKNAGAFNDAFGVQALYNNTGDLDDDGSFNDAFGYLALYSNTTGSYNVAVGVGAVAEGGTDGTASYNVGVGYGVLNYNGGNNNVAVGYYALLENTSGTNNVAVGYQALLNNTLGISSTAVGYQALYSNQTFSSGTGGALNQSDMTAVGYQAGYSTNNAYQNTYVGYNCGYRNTTGSNNTYIGSEASYHDTTGSENTAVGEEAGVTMRRGNQNTLVGRLSAGQMPGGYGNTMVGYQTDWYNTDSVNYNTIVGFLAGYETNAGYNTFLGYQAGADNDSTSTAGGRCNTAIGGNSDIGGGAISNSTAIGYNAYVDASNTIVLGSNGLSHILAPTTPAVTQIDINGALAPNTGIYIYNPGLAGNIFLSQGSGNNDTWLANGTSGQLLVSQGTGVPPNWVDPTSVSTGLTATYVGYGSASNTLTGDADFTRFKFGSYAAGGITLGDYFNNTYINSGLNYSGSVGDNNTALGWTSMYNVEMGSNNAAVGWGALYYDEYASQNTAMGSQALYFQDQSTSISNYYTTDNVAIGYQALYYNNPTGESSGVAINGNQNTAVGDYTGTNNAGGLAANITTGSDNTFIGYNATFATDGLYDCAAIGANTINTSATLFPLYPTMTFGDINVQELCSAAGYFATSDGRFKKNLNDNVPGLAFIKKLKPVTYNFDIEGLDEHIHGGKVAHDENYTNAMAAKDKVVCSGFVAQDVDAAAKAIGYNFDGVHKPSNDRDNYALNYAEFVVPLVKSVQELSAKSDSKDSIIAQQQQQLADQTNQIQSLQSANSAAQTQLQNQQSQLDQLSAMISKLDIALSQCCTNYQSTTTGSSQTGSNNNDAPLLNQNIPNPFSQNTIISCYVPTTAKGASISIFDLNGQLLKSFTMPTTGFNQITISGGTLAAGDYLYTLFVDGAKIDTKKMTLTY